jgi:hypothetical protein
LALRRLCLRRAGALHGSEIQVKQGLLFVALVFVLLAQAQDFPEDFHIEALSLASAKTSFLCESASEVDPSFLGQFNELVRRSAFGPHAVTQDRAGSAPVRSTSVANSRP